MSIRGSSPGGKADH